MVSKSFSVLLNLLFAFAFREIILSNLITYVAGWCAATLCYVLIAVVMRGDWRRREGRTSERVFQLGQKPS